MIKSQPLCFFILMTSIFILHGCGEDYYGDMADLRLPEYSESGRNHAGAYVNNEPWRSYPRSSLKGSADVPYLRYDSLGSQYVLIFPQGNLITASGTQGPEFDIRFIISAQILSPVFGGSAAYPLVVSIGSEGNYVELQPGVLLSEGNFEEPCISVHGLLYIRHATVYFGDQGQSIHLAGTFGFDVDDECGEYEVRSGRFDFLFQCAGGKCH